MPFIRTLWAFSRPHTIAGSFFSIAALYCITIAVAFPQQKILMLQVWKTQWLLTLASALACNLYITGLNQLQDIALDKLNKPWLPLAAGTLSPAGAKKIILVSGIAALAIAFYVSVYLTLLIAVIMAIGTAYSLPPLKFKRHHVAAAASILLVRGVLVNIGMSFHFMELFTGRGSIPADVWPLTFFVTGFSLAIAWFKDIPDTGGDVQFNIRTLALSLSPKVAFRYGVLVVAISYIGLVLLAAIFQPAVHQIFFFVSHATLLLLFLAGAPHVVLQDAARLKKAYLLFWGFFFAEYIVYPAAYYL